MRFTAVTLLAAAAVVSADRTYNITAAYLPGQLEKYKCLYVYILFLARNKSVTGCHNLSSNLTFLHNTDD